MAQEVKPALKNKSELLFEAYLRSQGHTDFAFEPEIQGTSRRPDYRLSWSEQDILFEVKEFRAEANDFGSDFGVPLTNVCKESKSSPRLNCVESATCESQQ